MDYLVKEKSMEYDKILCLIGLLILVYLIIFIGGLTRLTESGLSMVDWKPVGGILPPLNEGDWNKVFSDYKNYPEYKEKNINMVLADFKKIFYFEYIHRILGRIIGLALILPFFYFLIKKRLSTREIFHGVVLIVLLSFQGFFGWYMVKSGLVDVPRVSHYRLAIHLALALLFFSYLWLAFLNYLNFKKNICFKSRLSLNILIFFLAIQIIYGAFNSGLDSGLISSDYPKMFGEWIPTSMFFTGESERNFLSDPVFVNFFHRHWGVLLGVLLLLFSIKNLFIKNLWDIRIALGLLFLLALIQPLMGIALTVLNIPIAMASLHQVLAVLILLNLLYLRKRVH